MKFNYLLSIFIIFISICYSNAQTTVQGGIFSNTTWTKANSPYYIIGNVVVFPSETLTIQPGVIINFAGNTGLEIRNATIIAIGTPTDSITFTSDSSFHNGSWNCINLKGTVPDTTKFSYCNFNFSSKGITSYAPNTSNWVVIEHCTFKNNNIGICASEGNRYSISNSNICSNDTGIYYENSGYTPGICILNCIIDSNAIMGIDLETGSNTVINCRIFHNGIGICDYYVRGRFYTGNIICNNSIGLKLVGISYDSCVIGCNTLCNNSEYGLYFEDVYGGTLNAMNNYWCTTDSADVSGQIYDAHDDVKLGLVKFMPINSSQEDCSTSIKQNAPQSKTFRNTVYLFSKYIVINPVEGCLYTDINIFNIQGRLIRKSIVTNQNARLDISNLPNGTYFIQTKVKNESNCALFTIKN